MRRLILLICLLLPLNAFAQRTAFEGLRQLVDSGVDVCTEDFIIEGIVISDPSSTNNEKNVNSHYSYVSNAPAGRTVYIQDEKGELGLKLRFNATAIASLAPRYSKLKLNIAGAEIFRTEQGGYVVWGLGRDNIVSIVEGQAQDVPNKPRKISELTEKDIYTFVTIEDCEFVFKEGSYMDVYEPYLPVNKYNKNLYPATVLDTWVKMMVDGEGVPFYYMINGNCPWRRDGDGVPSGAGTFSGVVTTVELERYGDCLGKYQLIPESKSDFKLNNKSNFQTLAEWTWDDNSPNFNTTVGPRSSVKYERILADKGAGYLYSDIGEPIVRGIDMDNPAIEDRSSYGAKGEKGKVDKGALTVCAPASAWWNWNEDRGSAIVMNFSTEGLEGSEIFLAFKFAAGTISPSTSYDYPARWMVEYSVDGNPFTQIDCPDIHLHSYPWWWNTPVNGVKYMASTLMGLGMTEHFVSLPADLFGHKDVKLRIRPSCKVAATLGYENNEVQAIRRNLKTPTYVNFGALTIRYR